MSVERNSLLCTKRHHLNSYVVLLLRFRAHYKSFQVHCPSHSCTVAMTLVPSCIKSSDAISKGLARVIAVHRGSCQTLLTSWTFKSSLQDPPIQSNDVLNCSSLKETRMRGGTLLNGTLCCQFHMRMPVS